MHNITLHLKVFYVQIRPDPNVHVIRIDNKRKEKQQQPKNSQYFSSEFFTRIYGFLINKTLI